MHNCMMYDKGSEKVILDLDSYRGNVFIRAIKKLEIAKVQLVDRKKMADAEPGSPDVLLRSASGLQHYISRAELVKNYRHASGKKIVIPTLKSNTPYTVTKVCNEQYAALLLPSNMVGILRGRQITPGNYVVAPLLESGDIDYSKMAHMSRKLFRKMFYIPMQDVIRRNLGKGGYASNSVRTKKSMGRHTANVQNTPVKDYGLDVSKFNIPSINDNIQGEVSMPASKLNKDTNEIKISADKYIFNAVGRIVNESGEVVGYIIEDTRGNRRNFRVNTVMKMCSEHKVANVMLSKNESGKYYLRGNGMRLESLPQFLE